MEDAQKKKVADEYQWMQENQLPWKAWGSWFSWGSPVGLGLFFIAIGVTIWLLHMAGLIG